MDDCLKALRPNDICFKIDSFQEFEKYGSLKLGCGNNIAYLYFLSFMIIFSFMLLSLFVAIIMDIYSLRAVLEHSKVSASSLRRFTETWQKYDPDATGFLAWLDLKEVLQELGLPLSVQKENSDEKVVTLLFQESKVPVYKRVEDNEVYFYFYDIALGLSKKALL